VQSPSISSPRMSIRTSHRPRLSLCPGLSSLRLQEPAELGRRQRPSPFSAAVSYRPARKHLTTCSRSPDQFQPLPGDRCGTRRSPDTCAISTTVDIGDRVHAGQTPRRARSPRAQCTIPAASQSEQQRSKEQINNRASTRSAAPKADSCLRSHGLTTIGFCRPQRRKPGLIAEQELDDARAQKADASQATQVRPPPRSHIIPPPVSNRTSPRADMERLRRALRPITTITAPPSAVSFIWRYADTGRRLIQAGTPRLNSQSLPLVKALAKRSAPSAGLLPVPEERSRLYPR